MMKVKHPSIILKPTLLTGVVEETTKETPSYLTVILHVVIMISYPAIRSVSK